MLTWEDDVEVHALRKRGWSISAIARHTGFDRKTVRKYLAGDHQPGRTVAADECRVGVGDDVRFLERDVVIADPLPRVRREKILDEERHAAERTVGKIGACGGI